MILTRRPEADVRRQREEGIQRTRTLDPGLVGGMRHELEVMSLANIANGLVVERTIHETLIRTLLNFWTLHGICNEISSCHTLLELVASPHSAVGDHRCNEEEQN